MVTISSLWLPILISAVGVWLMSFLVWVVLPHHKSDYKALPDEEAARKALTPQNLEPGLYNIPHVTSWDDLKQPEVVRKFEEGPSAFITVVPKGVPTMGKKMVLSFVQNLFVAVLVAYMASRTLSAGAEYLAVFRVAGTTAWLACGAAYISDAIWFGRTWKAIGKFQFDALLYGLVTAGIFGWLWP